jgi:hypothetical protein
MPDHLTKIGKSTRTVIKMNLYTYSIIDRDLRSREESRRILHAHPKYHRKNLDTCLQEVVSGYPTKSEMNGEVTKYITFLPVRGAGEQKPYKKSVTSLNTIIAINTFMMCCPHLIFHGQDGPETASSWALGNLGLSTIHMSVVFVESCCSFN